MQARAATGGTGVDQHIVAVVAGIGCAGAVQRVGWIATGSRTSGDVHCVEIKAVVIEVLDDPVTDRLWMKFRLIVLGMMDPL